MTSVESLMGALTLVSLKALLANVIQERGSRFRRPFVQRAAMRRANRAARRKAASA